ncbi:MAG: hypothetical protein WC223_03495 [Bacteroidales bacterium]|jgi:hypothetical protein
MNILNIPVDFNQLLFILQQQLSYSERKKLAKLLERKESEDKVKVDVISNKDSAKDIFKALRFDTRGFKFNRDEANSR